MLYGSNLVRIPREIGAMASLEEFTPYTSYRLHWFPYEITRCRKLTRSTVSTRALFGNYKLRPPFPKLQPPLSSAANLDLGNMDPRCWGATTTHNCSVCESLFEQGGLHQVWISIRVATDVLPLLVSACSSECVAALPDGARDYIPTPHSGGRVDQPACDRDEHANLPSLRPPGDDHVGADGSGAWAEVDVAVVAVTGCRQMSVSPVGARGAARMQRCRSGVVSMAA